MKNIAFRSVISITIILLFLSGLNAFSGNKVNLSLKPFRVLVIIGDQWEDPAGYMITRPKPLKEYSGYFTYPELPGQTDFHLLMILLKSWAIPFDVVRLDQQLLDRYMFLDMSGKPIYGTIIWDVNQSDKIIKPNYAILKEMVENYGVGFIALSDRISPDPVQSLLGLKYKGSWESNKKMRVVKQHFLTKGLHSPFILDKETNTDYGMGLHLQRQQVEVSDNSMVLVKEGTYPQVTARSLPSGSHIVWIGNDHNHMFYYQNIRTLLRRAITWTIGYNIYKTWENNIMMIMDDPGGAQNVYLEHWHYPELTENAIEKYLIKPLRDHNAILNINFVPAFVSDKKRRLEPAWTQNFTDEFGTRQDYVSAKKGFDKGVKAGVFEVMCHGLTHMQPDLVSAPGWYGAPLDREKAEVGWYREFGDTRRHKEIPAAEQLWRMKTAKKWITQQFGITPLEFCPGGNGASLSYSNNTFRLAAQAGFGWAGWAQGYLGKDMVIVGWNFMGTPDSPLIIGAPPNGHDYGITLNPEAFKEIFNQYPHGKFIGMNEFIGYLHAKTSGFWNIKGTKLTVTINYDPHYCLNFKTNPSSWTLELSDWLENKTGHPETIKIDNKEMTLSPSYQLPIPSGTGRHIIEIIFR